MVDSAGPTLKYNYSSVADRRREPSQIKPVIHLLGLQELAVIVAGLLVSKKGFVRLFKITIGSDLLFAESPPLEYCARFYGLYYYMNMGFQLRPNICQRECQLGSEDVSEDYTGLVSPLDGKSNLKQKTKYIARPKGTRGEIFQLKSQLSCR